jgi:hypothetical protein
MILDRVTLTGADESIDPKALFGISHEYPFVEWGILYGSKSAHGSPRYPGRDWRDTLHADARVRYAGIDLKLSAHLCGRFVRDFVLDGKFSVADVMAPEDLRVYQRVQLNFHAHHHPGSTPFIEAMRKVQGKEFIFQMDEVNDDLWTSAAKADLPAVPLFDTSGGAGILPHTWPRPYANVYCGYAGGLGPENLVEQLRAISASAIGTAHVWIDMETRVRSENDAVFDEKKCRRVLELAAPFIGRRL